MSNKFQLYTGAIIIVLEMVFVVDVLAETSICPPPQECPPVLACEEGYSCQPDEMPIPQLEEMQQYPISVAESWVNTIVPTNTLTDVAINDPRWGGRQEGEVYARENENYIVWWWPKGGEATFDPTKLGGSARWHDYRLSQTNGTPRSGTLNLTAGMTIHFNDGGTSGVSIFEKLDDLPPSTGDFLERYTNLEQAKVPADGMYPFGQRMWMSMYAPNKSQLVKMNNAGMTISGPHYHGCSEYDYPPNIAETDAYGMKMFWRLYVGSGSWSNILEKMKTAEGRAVLTKKVERCIDVVLSDPVKNRVVVAWHGHEEEPIYRSSTPIEKQRDYMKMVRDIIARKDPKKRPYFVSERSDSSASNLMVNATFTSGITKQNYLIRKNGYGGDIAERFLIGQWVRDEMKAAKVNDEKGLSYTGKIRPVIAILPMYVDPDNPAERNEKWLRKAITHDFWLSIAMGAHGVNVWSWQVKNIHSHTTKDLQGSIYLDVIGKFTNAKLPTVFLWGNERTDIDMKIISGPKTFTWKKHRKKYIEPSIKFRNIQYGDNRYILLVNSAKQAVTVQLLGIPDGLEVADIIKGGSGGTTQTIQPLGVRMYKISKEL